VVGGRDGRGEEEGRKGKADRNGKDMGKGEDKGEEDGEGKGKGKDKGKEMKVNKGNLELRHWLRNAMVMLARVMGAYWQVVSPVFDGDSELRKRLDKTQGTRRDTVVCLLAVVFLFLVACGTVWAVRGIVWMVQLLGGLWEVLKVVAGL
jgi:nitrate reductase NapE component